jgi:hypothetical protein
MTRRNSMLSLVLVGCVAVLVVDAVGSVIAKTTGVSYTWFGIASWIVYASIGVVAARRFSLGASALAGLIVSGFEATVGWWVAWQIGPGRVTLPPGMAGPIAIVVTIIIVVILNTAVATVAGAISRMRQRSEINERSSSLRSGSNLR